MRSARFLSVVLVVSSTSVSALDLDPKNADSIKSAAKAVAKTVVSLYNGNKSVEIPGIFSTPGFYWWQAAPVWDALVDYSFLTGDTTYNDIVGKALQFQVGPNNDYMPPNQTKSEGNDDQSFWALAAMTAAERNFPAPNTSIPTWSTLATNVFNTQAARWDDKTCGGGVRWQIFSFNNGYNYKNSQSNGNLFELSARLAAFTKNATYSDWAEKTYSWLEQVGFVNNGAVYDGADLTTNCTSVSHLQWSNNAGALIYGSAIMYNLTSDAKWRNRTSTLLNATLTTFFKDGIMEEVACENIGTCASDQTFFKGITAIHLARTAVVAPFTAQSIMPLLQSSATGAAVNACTAPDGSCTLIWTASANNASTSGVTSLGTDFSALEVIQANLVGSAKSIVTQNGSTAVGGNSSSSGSASGSTAKGSGVNLAIPGLLSVAQIFGLILLGHVVL
ncbi:putative cell wall glycosyl hydrolase Dfg5 [Microthyrium microscopicum]|uniref:Mannan endo-1,6-alpha-mannosidase n=1 Tax=Microthyrium microscopicum TaxID=703497 RepID=A0A6A6UGC8_9PEZI|nr:putative cell wall glycosyl hydrolase Dfg5 [Microthyrium microscopicum]